jgi:hypothetical protein
MPHKYCNTSQEQQSFSKANNMTCLTSYAVSSLYSQEEYPISKLNVIFNICQQTRVQKIIISVIYNGVRNPENVTNYVEVMVSIK